MTRGQELARFVERTSYEDLSEGVRRELKVRVLDSLGCAMGALEWQSVRRIRERIEEFGGNPLATLIGGGRTAPDRAVINTLGLEKVMFEAAEPEVFEWYV